MITAAQAPAGMNPLASGRSAWLSRRLARLLRWLMAGLLCLSPFTAILVLGWLQRRLRYAASRRLQIDLPVRVPNLITAEPGTTRRFSAGLVFGALRNVATGARALLAALLLTLPFSLCWLFAWWAGWENSFNKGYEQAWVGPALGMSGSLIAVILLPMVPYALAHVAMEQRLSAVLAWHRIRHIVARSGWWVVAVSATVLLCGLVVFIARTLPVFGDFLFAADMPGGMADWSSADLERTRRRIAFFASGALLSALMLLCHVSAIAYAAGVREANPVETTKIVPAAAALARFLLCRFLASGFVILIFIGQFLNHSWTFWNVNPVLVLPWLQLP